MYSYSSRRRSVQHVWKGKRPVKRCVHKGKGYQNSSSGTCRGAFIEAKLFGWFRIWGSKYCKSRKSLFAFTGINTRRSFCTRSEERSAPPRQNGLFIFCCWNVHVSVQNDLEQEQAQKNLQRVRVVTMGWCDDQGWTLAERVLTVQNFGTSMVFRGATVKKLLFGHYGVMCKFEEALWTNKPHKHTRLQSKEPQTCGARPCALPPDFSMKRSFFPCTSAFEMSAFFDIPIQGTRKRQRKRCLGGWLRLPIKWESHPMWWNRQTPRN